MDDYTTGAVTFEIKMIATQHENLSNIIFKTIATAAKLADLSAQFNVMKNEYNLIKGDGTGVEPTVSWNGSGNQRTLQISLPAAWTAYFIDINISSWRLIPKDA